ncbi:DUF2073 domain-containing protein [Candidatus Woesearchaeota archaeon]|nr:DUF2073 domain-containing protein [Candidatus Woesearchaeota archaeon]
MLTLQFVPYHEIESLSSSKRVSKLLDIVKLNKILLLEGRLTREEEADLIKKTMQDISNTFKGIELGVVYPNYKDANLLGKLKYQMINTLLGNRIGLTIIGPASIVKEIKQDPNKIELLTKNK